MKRFYSLMLAALVFGMSLLPSSALAASTTIQGVGPNMTQRGVEYHQYFAQGNPGAVRTITSVSWQWSFDTGQFCFGGIGGGTTCQPYPQPTPMNVFICYNSVSCVQINGQTSGSTNAWAGQQWMDYALITIYWQPQGSGALQAAGKMNKVTINYN